MTRVLVVDDIEANRYLLRSLLTGSGFEVEEAANGAEALLKARENPPQLCISDLLMPVKDGFALLREWKRDARLSLAPFVVYTATYTDPRDEQLVNELGADAFIVKPEEPEIFVARLFEVLARVPSGHPPREPTAEATVTEAEHRQALARKLEKKVMELEEANLELSVRNAELRTFLQTEPESVIALSAGGRILQVNDSGLEMLEARDAAEVLDREFSSLVDAEDRARFGEMLEAVRRGERGRIEHRVVGLGGSVRWLETHCNLLRAGTQQSILCVARDMTERLLLAESRERERVLSSALLRGLPGIFYLFDEAGKFVRWNERFETVTGYSSAEIARLHPVDLFEGAERDYIAGRIAEVFAKGESDAEASLVSKPGLRTPYYFTGVRVELAGKAHLAGTGVDLSARRHAEQALGRAVAWQRAIFDSADVAIVSTDIDGVVQTYNASAERMFGYPAAEVVAKAGLGLFHDPAEVRAQARASSRARGAPVSPDFEVFVLDCSDGRPTEHEWTGIRKDGSRFPVRLTTSAMLDARGECIGYLAIATDLTEKRAREAVSRLQSAALDAAANSIMITDRRGTIEWINPAFTALTGYAAEEALGQTPRILKSGVQSESFYVALWKTVLAGQVWRSELVNRRKDGSLYHEEETITPLVDQAGRVSHFIAIKQDISDRKRAELEQWKLEEQLRVSEKLRAIGSLAGGIAHDFNNLLAVILSYAEVAADSLPEQASARADLLEIRAAGLRAAELTRQLLAFSRRQAMKVEPVDMNGIARGLEKMMRRLIGKHIDVDLKLAADLGVTRADPGQMEQVIINLALNARDAMPEGGALTIATKNSRVDEARAEEDRGVDPGDYVVLRVTDTGTGIDEATRQRIFEPFFTTKEHGKGTGLGLSTVHGIIEQTGGRVWVYSELGVGTTFEIYLPRLPDGTAAAAAEQGRPEARAVGTETVLVVEDEAPVRNIVERLLRAAGYTVLTAQHGQDALRLAERHSAKIDLVLTDVAMPKLGGRALVAELLRARPAIKAVYMSGYADDAILDHGVLDAGLHFIGKPFGGGELLRKVRDVLDE